MPQLSADQITGSNLLINGGFRIWQRGTSFSLTAGTYGPDKWEAVNGSVNVNQDSDSLYGDFASLVEDTDTGADAGIQQSIEDVSDFQGQTITVRAEAKQGPTSPASQAKLVVEDSDGTNVASSSDTVSLGSSYGSMVVTHTVQSDATSLTVRLLPATSTGDGSDTGEALFDGVTAVVGDRPVDYPQVARPIGQEQGLCERYYEVLYTNQGVHFPISGGNQADVFLAFRTTKSASPTTTVNIDNINALSHDDSLNTTDTGSWSLALDRSTIGAFSIELERDSLSGSTKVIGFSADFEAEVT